MTDTAAVTVGKEEPPVAAASGSRPLARLVEGVVVAVLVVAVFVVLEELSWHVSANSSDQATAVLQGQAMARGQWTLPGWSLPLDPWWSLGVPFDALGVAIIGVSPVLLHVVPALFATGLVLVGVVLIRQVAHGLAAWVGTGVLLGALALPTPALAYWFLTGELHVETALWCLIAFVALRKGRFGIGWLVGVVFLTAGLLGDLQTAAFGSLPLAAAAVVIWPLRLRSWRAGAAPGTAVVASSVLAYGVHRWLRHEGGFQVHGGNPISSPHQAVANVVHAGRMGVTMLGAWTPHAPGQQLTASGIVHWVLPILFALAAVVTVVGMARSVVTGSAASAGGHRHSSQTAEQPWRIDDLLVMAAVCSFAVFCGIAVTNNPAYARYLTAAIIFGAVLTGRVVARWAQGKTFPATRVAAVLTVAMLVVFAVPVWRQLRQPKPVPSGLGSFLASHGLHIGVGAYWTASITTVLSKGQVVVRPVEAGAGNRLTPFPDQDSESWFRGQAFQFVVYTTPTGPSEYGVDLASAEATWGRPARILDYPGYQVLVWSSPRVLPGQAVG